MAIVLTTKQSAATLEDILRKAKTEIYLISFSFIISDAFITRIRQAVERGVLINIVYGKSIRRDSYDQLIRMPNLNIYFQENMHAKVFANEIKCVVGSMNFSEASENRNIELGVLLSSQNDGEAYNDVIRHCKEIISEKNTILEYPTKIIPKPNVIPKAKAVDVPNLAKMDRFDFVTKVLRDNYGSLTFDDLGYGDLASYNLKVYMNDYRIDFIFGDNPKYEPKRKLLKQVLGKKMRERFWVNKERVNIEAATNSDLQNAISEVLSFTLVHLI